MKRFRRCDSNRMLTRIAAFAQGPAAETARVEPPQAAVTVVFAPDYDSAPRPSLPGRHARADQAPACGVSIRRRHGF